MNFLYPIYTEITECQDCYKCIRQCPVKAIRVENGHAIVIPELCIMCGQCVIQCPAQAKRIRNDLSRAKRLLELKPKVIVSLAPSFVAEFSDFSAGQCINALKKLGFFGVSETAIGADLVSAQIAEDLIDAIDTHSNRKLFLSSACPSVVEYIKLFIPEYTPFITDRASPLLAHARYLREVYGTDIGIVFIGPCVAKKIESDVWDEIDVAITFNELRNWFSSQEIIPSTLISSEKDIFIPHRAAAGALYPIDGGMIATTKEYNALKNIRNIAISGIDEIIYSLKGLRNEDLKDPVFIELLACSGGCINGPGTSSEISATLKHLRVLEYADSVEKTLEKKRPLMTDTLPTTAIDTQYHSEDHIKTALRSVGKHVPTDELNCASCGYDTCRFFASAMLDNRAEKTMCVSYIRKLAQKKANGLIQAIPSGVVIADKNLEIVECNKSFAQSMGADILEMYEVKPGLEGANLSKIVNFSRFFTDVLLINGPEVIEREVHEGKKIFHVTVFTIEKEEIAGGVIEDITDPRTRKKRVVTHARNVIDKNLSVVQQIAFLLGENAAETESMLNSIIESFGNDDELDT